MRIASVLAMVADPVNCQKGMGVRAARSSPAMTPSSVGSKKETALGQAPLHRLDDRGRGEAERAREIDQVEVDVTMAVDIGEAGALPRIDENRIMALQPGHPGHGHARRHDAFGTREHGLGFRPALLEAAILRGGQFGNAGRRKTRDAHGERSRR